jgi:anti-sigma regulatory factor (Ser/Thr protein kinase)
MAATREAELMCRPLMLGAVATAASCAREVSRLQLAEWGLSVLRDVADVIVSEFVANAVRACQHRDPPGQLAVCLSASGPFVRIEVWDTGPGFPLLNPDVRTFDESGRGLHLIDTLSGGRWGAWQCPDEGKVVWAEITKGALA